MNWPRVGDDTVRLLGGYRVGPGAVITSLLVYTPAASPNGSWDGARRRLGDVNAAMR